MFDREASVKALWAEMRRDALRCGFIIAGCAFSATRVSEHWQPAWTVFWVLTVFVVAASFFSLASSIYLHIEKVKLDEAKQERSEAQRRLNEAKRRRDEAQQEWDEGDN